MDLLEGDTPKQKYDYLKSIIKAMTGKRFLFCIKYHNKRAMDTYNHAIPAYNHAIPAFNKDEALEIFWEDKSENDFVVSTVTIIDTIIQ